MRTANEIKEATPAVFTLYFNRKMKLKTKFTDDGITFIQAKLKSYQNKETRMKERKIKSKEDTPASKGLFFSPVSG